MKNMCEFICMFVCPGNTNQRGSFSTIDLLIKVACFVKMVSNIFKIILIIIKQGALNKSSLILKIQMQKHKTLQLFTKIIKTESSYKSY
jgi:hypothetical protein